MIHTQKGLHESEAPFALLWYSHAWERAEITHSFPLGLWNILYSDSCASFPVQGMYPSKSEFVVGEG